MLHRITAPSPNGCIAVKRSPETNETFIRGTRCNRRLVAMAPRGPRVHAARCPLELGPLPTTAGTYPADRPFYSQAVQRIARKTQRVWRISWHILIRMIPMTPGALDTAPANSARYIIPLALVAAFLVALAVAGMFSNTDTASNSTASPPVTTSESTQPTPPAETTPPASTGASTGESGSAAAPRS